MKRWRFHWPILAILALFLLLGAGYSVINPLFESPDEVWHYEYVRWLTEGHGLPRPEDVGHAPWHQEGSQPPLYYLLAAGVTAGIPTDNADQVIRYNPHVAMGQGDAFGNKNVIVHGRPDAWPWRGAALAAHIARFLSLLLGAITVLAVYGAAWAVFPGNRALAAGAAALTAFNPQFIFLSAAVNNDNLVVTLAALTIWLVMRLLGRKEPPRARHFLLLVLLAGLAAASKLSGLAAAGLAGLTILIWAWRTRSIKDFLVWSLLAAAVAIPAGGWWYARNAIFYHDPLFLKAMFDILPRRAQPPTLQELLARAPGVWRSFWAVFGWFNVVVDSWLYAVYTGLTLAGLAGLLIIWPLRLWRAREGGGAAPPTPASRAQFGVLVIWIGVIFLALLQWAQMRYPQGRLLFPALGAFAILIVFGLSNWLPRRWHGPAAAGFAAALLLIAFIAPRWIVAAYAPPPPVSTQPRVTLNARLGDHITLAGYSLDRERARPGDDLLLTLFWRTDAPLERDYSVFVHLVDDLDIIQAQHDTYPGAGALPTSDWRPGELITDAHRIHIPETAPAPGLYHLRVGLYDYATGTRLPTGEPGDFVTLGAIDVQPRTEAGVPNPIHVNFDDQIELVGFRFDRRSLRPGETLTIDLWWRALTKPKKDYIVFTHLVYPPDAVWAGHDSAPQGGASPTSAWQPGQIIPDQHQLTLPENAPPGVYFVEIGVYHPDTGRLSVNFSDKGVVLGQVRVQ